MILEELEEEGQIIRKAYQRRLPSDTSKDYYFMQRNTGDVQSLTVEYGFLDNATDARKLKDNWQSYADAVVDAVSRYIGVGIEGETYTVKSGDSLWSIAKKLGVSVEELKAVNDLSSNLLKVGQILKVPKEEIIETGDYIIYTVQTGDSLYSIARKYGLTVDELVDYNNLSSTALSINQQILIPKKDQSPSDDVNAYTVKNGDTLYSIARQFNTTVNELMSLNNLKTSVLSVGQMLQIPRIEENSNYIEYIVKSGDSLYVLANKYGTTVNEIKNFNNLTSNLLSIGQVLRIPKSGETVTYTVKSGDNLYSIARKYNTSAAEIKRKNNLSSNLLSIGQILVI